MRLARVFRFNMQTAAKTLTRLTRLTRLLPCASWTQTYRQTDVYVGSYTILLYLEFFVLVWLILLLISVVRTSASECLEDRL